MKSILKNKKIRVYSLSVVVMGAFMSVIVCISCLMTGCQEENIVIDKVDFSTYLSLNKSNFDYARDWNNLSENDKNTFRLAKKRMDITFEKDGICRTKWTSSNQVNISDELFECFINMIDFTNEVTKELSEIQWTPPRLKSGWEFDSSRAGNCVVQSLSYVLQNFGVYSGPYGLSSIDNWIYTNGYYSYDANYGWGASVTPVLSHYLEGSYIPVSYLSSASASNQYIMILSGSPPHAVVFSSYGNYGTVNYYDPQNSVSGSCSMSNIGYVYRATNFNHY